MSHLTTFRHSVVRLLHLRDLPDGTIVHRLHSLINAHEEYSSISKRYDEPSTPPLPAEETLPPVSSHHRPLSASPVRRYSDHFLDSHSHHGHGGGGGGGGGRHHERHHDHFDDDFKF